MTSSYYDDPEPPRRPVGHVVGVVAALVFAVAVVVAGATVLYVQSRDANDRAQQAIRLVCNNSNEARQALREFVLDIVSADGRIDPAERDAVNRANTRFAAKPCPPVR